MKSKFGAGPGGMLDYPALVEALARRQRMSERDVRMVIRGLVSLVADGLREGKDVRIVGLGMLRIRPPLPRQGSDGANRVVLAAAKPLKTAANGG